jgi:glycosyltransferase involved in cell wall biosynthesis
VVVPNGYTAPARPLGRVTVGRPPTLLLQGLLYYTPNTYGAVWLVGTVLPHLRRLQPDVRVRLVGAANDRVRALARPPEVEVTGRVPDMAPELARADVVVAPVLYGGGTRIKILEAFAHRIPVVSTPVGIEGIDATDGIHLLVADDPREFAEACARLTFDEDLRARLADRAERLFLERYRWTHVRAGIAALAHAVAGTQDRREQRRA